MPLLGETRVTHEQIIELIERHRLSREMPLIPFRAEVEMQGRGVLASVADAMGSRAADLFGEFADACDTYKSDHDLAPPFATDIGGPRATRELRAARHYCLEMHFGSALDLPADLALLSAVRRFGVRPERTGYLGSQRWALARNLVLEPALKVQSKVNGGTYRNVYEGVLGSVWRLLQANAAESVARIFLTQASPDLLSDVFACACGCESHLVA